LIIFIVPKNSGLEICSDYINKYISDKTKILKVRGEDVPLFVEKLSKLRKNVIGITGDDLFKEYSFKNSSFKIKEKIIWNNEEFLFKKPTLCLLGSKFNSLEKLPKKINICINKKYKNISGKFLREYFKDKNYEITYTSGATEELFSQGVVDLIIDIVCSGKSAKEAGLKVYEKIFESDIVAIEYQEKKLELQELYNIIDYKIKSNDEKSYTKKLTANTNELKRKLIEEAGEVITADSRENLIWECSDLIYFLFVIMAKEGITIEDIEKENERRNKETLINKQNQDNTKGEEN
jgi:phosphoribosyl-ATP pyrophosphohydrolase